MSAGVSRRAALGASGAMLLLAPAAIGVTKSPGLDADLLAACAAFQATDAFCKASKYISDDVTDALIQRWYDAFDAVAAIPAVTPEGSGERAKVAFAGMLVKVKTHPDATWQQQADCYDRLAMECLLNMAGRA